MKINALKLIPLTFHNQEISSSISTTFMGDIYFISRYSCMKILSNIKGVGFHISLLACVWISSKRKNLIKKKSHYNKKAENLRRNSWEREGDERDEELRGKINYDIDKFFVRICWWGFFFFFHILAGLRALHMWPPFRAINYYKDYILKKIIIKTNILDK